LKIMPCKVFTPTRSKILKKLTVMVDAKILRNKNIIDWFCINCLIG
jgi:hypothetical protein